MKREWKPIPEVGDKIEAYVNHPPVRIVKVTPYTGLYKEIFTHFIDYVSPNTLSGIGKGCWPMACSCWVVKD